jgi:hypothetical protein
MTLVRFVAVDSIVERLDYIGLMLRNLCGHNKDEEAEEFETLKNEELGCSYRTHGIVKIAGQVSRTRETRNAIRV